MLITQIARVMKLTALLLLIGCLTASAKGLSQVTLTEKNAPLEKVFKQIETYSTLRNKFVAQHCKHIEIESIYLFLILLIIILIIIIIFTISISEIELKELKQNHSN